MTVQPSAAFSCSSYKDAATRVSAVVFNEAGHTGQSKSEIYWSVL
jgi:hypothetical protein